RRRVGREEVPPVRGGPAARRAVARPVLHRHRLLRARERHLRHAALPRPLPGRLPVHRPALDRAAVRGTGIRRGRPVAWPSGFMKSTVAVLRVTPNNILSDIDRVVELGGVSHALASGKTTILKDNISWHFPFPGANTTPWQLEGTIQALARRGYT